MLDYMRKYSQSFLIYLLFGALIVVFAISFGPGSPSCGTAGTDFAALVNGETITIPEFQRTYSSEFYRWQARNPEYFTPEQARKMNLRGRVLDMLISRRLLADEAQRRGLVVTDEELKRQLTDDTRFQVEGHFDLDAYQSYVNQAFGMSVARYEAMQRRELLSDKMIELVLGSVDISRQELEAEYRVGADRVKVDFVRFDPLRHAQGAEPGAEEVSAALAQREAEVRAFYEREYNRYREQRRVKVRRILVPLAPDAGEQALAAAQGAVAALQQELAGGADFAALAARQQTPDGGDLGWLGDSPEQRLFAQAVATLQPGELAPDAVRSRDGLNLLRLEQAEAPRQLSFDELKERVARDMLADERGAAAAKAAAEALLAQLKAGAAFDKLTVPRPEGAGPHDAPGARPWREQTDWITRDLEAIPRIGIDPQLLADIFTLAEGSALLPSVYRVGRHYYVVRLAEREQPQLELFDANLEMFRVQALRRKGEQVLSQWLKAVRDRADVDINQAAVGYRDAAPDEA